MREEARNEKVGAIYHAVAELLGEGADLSTIKVFDITKRAGMGKATAYDYFSSKEELIIRALLYFLERMIERLIRQMNQLDTFREKFEFICTQMEEKTKERICAMKYLNLLNKKGKWEELKRKYADNCGDNKSNPIRLVRYLIDEGEREGLIDSSLPMSYREIAIASRFMSYMVYVDQKEAIKDCDSTTMRACLYKGMLKELSADK